MSHGHIRPPMDLHIQQVVTLYTYTHTHIQQVVTTGHSLGAGVAVILALLLRPAYPTIQCYTFGTPASMLDRQSSERYACMLTSVVYKNDIVCRLSYKVCWYVGMLVCWYVGMLV